MNAHAMVLGVSAGTLTGMGAGNGTEDETLAGDY